MVVRDKRRSHFKLIRTNGEHKNAINFSVKFLFKRLKYKILFYQFQINVYFNSHDEKQNIKSLHVSRNTYIIRNDENLE